MTIPARAVTPALLQVDAIQGRLRGPDAAAEIGRYLCSELTHLRTVLIVPEAPDALSWVREEYRWAATEALRRAATEAGGWVDERLVRPVAVPGDPGEFTMAGAGIRDGPDLVGAVALLADRPGAFDASERRFAQALAGRLAGLVRVDRRLPTI